MRVGCNPRDYGELARITILDRSRGRALPPSHGLTNHANGPNTAELLTCLSHADVLFLGEQYDGPETHRAEYETIASIASLGRPVFLSLKMFERDVQPALDDYLAGRISEPEFLARARTQPN